MVKTRLLFSMLLVLGIGQAQATLISNAAYAGAFVRDCRSAAAIAAGSTVPDKCHEEGTDPAHDFRNTMQQMTQDAAYGGFTASAFATHPLGVVGANATGSTVDASGAAGTLVLKQGAFTSAPYARVSGWSVALQSFSYDGTGPAVRTVSGNLDYTASNLMGVSDFNANTSSPGALIQAFITVFSLTSPSLDYVVPPSVPFFSSAASEIGAGYREEGSVLLTELLTNPYSASVTFTPELGRTYFVESRLALYAKFGGAIDALHTFNTTVGVTDSSGVFTPTLAGFTPAAPLASPVGIPSTVPEPSTALLALLAAAAAVRFGKRTHGRL